MGRPRRDSNKSDSGSTAGNVYNASLAAAQKGGNAEVNPHTASSGTTLTPQLDVISLVATSEIEKEVQKVSSSPSLSMTNITAPVPSSVPVAAPQASTATTAIPSNIHRRSLSVAELVSLISSRNSSAAGTDSSTATPPHSASSSSTQALNALNLPDALRSTLEKADSPILNALLPLIRQKLAAKTASNRRNSAVDLRGSGSVGTFESNDSSTSLDSRRSSTSSRSEDHRLSHKLAERKRRKEMKDIFDGLKDALPPGVPKSSKWEILNEASVAIDDLLEQEQTLLNQRNQLLKKINEDKGEN